METSNTQPMAGRRIVVGIDFGTTFSGISYAHIDDPKKIVVLTNWPTDRANDGGRSSDKVPTQLRYLTESEFEWGFQIPSNAPPSSVLTLFKLGLEPEKLHRASEVTGKALEIEDVDQKINDYLSGIIGQFMSTLRRQIGTAIIETTSFQFLLTVPAIWSEHAKDRTEKAFNRVQGLPPSFETVLITEPEAAATSAIDDLELFGLKRDDTFVVVDAGGGTVDLITYTIETLNPLRVNEVSPGSGDFCGSSRVNERFRLFITSKLEHEEGWDLECLQDAEERFERETKKIFTLDALARDDTFNIPVPGLSRNAELGVTRNGRFSLKASDVHMFFEPDIIRIIGLVKEQIAMANKDIRAVLLVGGYGSSMYLRDRLQMAIDDDNSVAKGAQVLQPANAWTSVVRGAVLTGLAMAKPDLWSIPRVKERVARKHYGHELSIAYNENLHASIRNKWYYDIIDGTWRVNVMVWFVERGHKVTVDTAFLYDFKQVWPVSAGRVNEVSISVYSDETSERAPLIHDENVNLLCRVVADVSHIPEENLDKITGIDGRIYYSLDCEIEAVFRTASTEYTLIHKGRRYETVSAEYAGVRA
ncbi:hypothetical protein F4778DRAFT_789845 [Xylariomycetidae sp. FL2044]|nr:hypothetical protein F4778DRAFT_789845 [Xylariomycetidae sp. FL2044]